VGIASPAMAQMEPWLSWLLDGKYTLELKLCRIQFSSSWYHESVRKWLLERRHASIIIESDGTRRVVWGK
jgi:hypothetical protein